MVCEVLKNWQSKIARRRLNPCFRGIWSVRIDKVSEYYEVIFGLNPCFCGIWSVSKKKWHKKTWLSCLNPCFRGIWSVSWTHQRKIKVVYVLILVFVEYGLWEFANPPLRGFYPQVLILVFVEYGLWAWTSTDNWPVIARVLILVFVEYGLWAFLLFL